MSSGRSLIARPRFALTLVALLVVLDQVVKWVVETTLPLNQQMVVLPVLSLFRTHNDGIAFSMLSGLGEHWLLAITFVVIAFVTILWTRSSPYRWLSQIGYALIVAGAIGNLVDRSTLGYVVDYILFHVGDWYFAVFNIADALISVGAAAIIVDELFGHWIYAKERNNGT